MADTVTTQLVKDTVDHYVLLCTNASDATGESAVKKQLATDLKYRLFTLTFASAPTTNLCIGEILTMDAAGTPVYAVVQNYTAGASTATCYLVTSGTDSTPIAASSGALIGTNKTVTGSISGTQPNTHSSTAAAWDTPDFNVRRLWWACSNLSAIVEFDGSSAEQTIGVLGGSSRWDLRNSDMGAIPMTATGNTSDVLGDVQITTHSIATNSIATNGGSYNILIEVGKVSGFNTPNYEGNANLGYLSSAAGLGY